MIKAIKKPRIVVENHPMSTKDLRVNMGCVVGVRKKSINKKIKTGSNKK